MLQIWYWFWYLWKKEIGGRVKIIKFDDEDVVAGIGRKKKDKLLFKLCQELGVSTHEYKTHFSYTFEPYDILLIIEEMKNICTISIEVNILSRNLQNKY